MKNQVYTQKIQSFTGGIKSNNNFIKLSGENELKKIKSKILGQGNHLSYAPVSFTNGVGIKINNNNLEINTKEDTLIVSSSITIGEVVNKISKKGYTLFNIPSHPEITIGGAIANNTHGKNQFLYNNFGDNIIEIGLYYNNSIEKISKKNKPDLFFATIGGLGLTGIIFNAKLKIQKLENKIVKIKKKKINSLKNVVKYYNKKFFLKYDSLYTWNDLNNKNSFGCGFIFTEKYVKHKKRKDKDNYYLRNTIYKSKKSNFYKIFGNYIIKLMNYLFYFLNTQKINHSTYQTIIENNFSNKKQIYFNIANNLNMIEIQLIVPIKIWDKFCDMLEYNIKKHKIFIFLCVCKFSQGKKKYLSFSDNGINIALNFTYKKNCEFLKNLDEFIISNNIINYICKDFRSNKKTIQMIYKDEYVKFCSVLKKYLNIKINSNIFS